MNYLPLKRIPLKEDCAKNCMPRIKYFIVMSYRSCIIADSITDRLNKYKHFTSTYISQNTQQRRNKSTIHKIVN